MRCTRPPAGGSGSWWAASCVDHAALVTNWKPSGEKPRGQWKSTNQNRDSSSLRERARLHPQPRIVDVLRLPARIPVEELVDGNDLCHGHDPQLIGVLGTRPHTGCERRCYITQFGSLTSAGR